MPEMLHQMADNVAQNQGNHRSLLGGLGLAVSLGSFIYNAYQNYETRREQNALNKTAQSNFENHYSIASKDLMRNGFNPSVLFQGAAMAAAPTSSASSSNPIQSDIASIMSAITGEKLARSQIENQEKLTASQVDLNEAQADFYRSNPDAQREWETGERNKQREHEVKLAQIKFENERRLQKFQHDHDLQILAYNRAYQSMNNEEQFKLSQALNTQIANNNRIQELLMEQEKRLTAVTIANLQFEYGKELKSLDQKIIREQVQAQMDMQDKALWHGHFDKVLDVVSRLVGIGIGSGAFTSSTSKTVGFNLSY